MRANFFKSTFCWMTFVLIFNFVTSSVLPPDDYMSSCNCSSEIVETTPQEMTPGPYLGIYDSWKSLIDEAQESIEIGSYAWNLRPYEYFANDSLTVRLGSNIYDSLLTAGTKRNVSIKIIRYQNGKTNDTDDLVAANAAEVRNFNVESLIHKPGIMHAKFIIVDRKHIYMGSCNFKAISLVQNKEIGMVFKNCPLLANDLKKIFDIYWELGKDNSWNISDNWQQKYNTRYNKDAPLTAYLNNDDDAHKIYISSSPALFSTPDRTTDLNAILDVIGNADKFIYITVMDYYPIFLYEHPKRYWPDVEVKMKSVLINKGVKIKLLIGNNVNKIERVVGFLKSLQSFDGALPQVDLQIKYYVVPKLEKESGTDPHYRIVHSKYIVTDKSVYFGNSNWGGEYMSYSTGVGLTMTPMKTQGGRNVSNVRDQLEDIFHRDWKSPNALKIDEYPKNTSSFNYLN